MTKFWHIVRPGAVTIRGSLLRTMVVLILITSGATLISTFIVGARKTVQSKAAAMMANAMHQTTRELENFSREVERRLFALQEWGRLGLLQIEDAQSLNRLFMPMLQHQPRISSLELADSRGREWMLLREPDGWRVRLSWPQKWGKRKRFERWQDAETRLKSWWEENDYDSRQRPWFKGAIANRDSGGIHWTEPYIFYTMQAPGITASIAWQQGSGQGQLFVGAFDVLLADISEFVASVHLAQHGKLFVFDDSGRVLGKPEDLRGSQPAEKLQMREIDYLLGRWRQDRAAIETPVRFKSGDAAWWGSLKPFSFGTGRRVWIGALVPEADFLADIRAWRNYVLLISAGALLIAILAAVLLSRIFSRPLQSLAGESRKIRQRVESDERRLAQSSVALDDEVFETVAPSGLREIDMLADDIREMANLLHAKTLALEQYSQTLEDKVEERTRDLHEKNAELKRTLQQLRAAQQQLIMQEKMASLGNLVAGVAHEINNPIGAVNAAADIARRCIAQISEVIAEIDAEVALTESTKIDKLLKLLLDNNATILDAGERVSEIVKSLKNFSRLDESDFQKTDIHEGLDSTLALMRHEIRNKAKIIRDYGEIPEIYCYPGRLNQVFMNLLRNAVQALNEPGEIRISTSATGEHVTIKIADTGEGIPKENLGKIFDPGFTTRGVGTGTGLGLATVYTIVQQHRGEIRVSSEVGKGTEVVVVLPVRLIPEKGT